MGRHRKPDVPPSAHGRAPQGGATRSDPRRGRRQGRLATGLLGVSVTLALVAATFGVVGVDAAGTSDDGVLSSAALSKSLVTPHRSGDPDRLGDRVTEAQRGHRPAGPTSSSAPAATSPPAAVAARSVTPAPAADKPSGTSAQTVSSATGVTPGRGRYAPPTAPYTDCTNFVASDGNDAAAGSAAAPWRTVLKALNAATAGAVLCVMPGTYVQEVVDSSLPDGTAGRGVTLKSYDPSNRATLDGRFALSNLSFWTIRDLRFTNPTPTTVGGAPTTNNVDRRIVSLLGGNDVLFENNEVFGGLYAGLLVSRAGATSEIPHRYTLRANHVHDTAAANLYFNTGRWSTGNLIERNIFANSGTENAKIGWGDDCRGVATNTDAYGAGEVEFRFNTLSNGGPAGSFMAAEPGGLYDVRVHHNIFSDPQSERGFLVRYDSATNSAEFARGCAGDRVFVTDNIAIGGTRFSEDFGDSPVSRSHEAGNRWPLDPQFDAAFVPQNPAARAYGHAAP
ncbi:MAG: hypothetical protein JWR45_67 [Blastococcus sp.]|nr:hypothetical protein [Blastococcus sp.]